MKHDFYRKNKEFNFHFKKLFNFKDEFINDKDDCRQ